ncbi:MAG: NRDE family protein, partial [Psychromonas sp.]
MCTLTYLLTDTGYELFFNRDELRSRQQAIAPLLNNQLKTIYPIDPVGKGTWLAVHESGLSLALLNFYHAQQDASGEYLSRGKIIVSLMKDPNNVINNLNKMDFSEYLPFQLCIFTQDLSLNKDKVRMFQWTGSLLQEVEVTLPITSSSVAYPVVYKQRQVRFSELVNSSMPTREQLIAYHDSQETDTKLSVRMSRPDAQTVSFSHIIVDQKIHFHYHDYIPMLPQDTLSVTSSVT